MTMTRLEKTAVILATVAVLLLVALAFATPANGETYTAPGEPVPLSVDSEANKVSFWCEPDDAGVKYEPVATPYIVPEPPEGKTWTLLVLKGGTTNEVIQRPVVGQGYSHSAHENSHVILCWEDEEVTTTTTSSTTTSSTTTSTSSTTSSTSTSTTQPPTTTTVPTTTSSSTTTSTPTSTTTTALTTTTSTETPSTTTTSTVPPSTSTPTDDTLPVTGAPESVKRLGIAGLVFLAVGVAILAGSWAVGLYRTRGDS